MKKMNKRMITILLVLVSFVVILLVMYITKSKPITKIPNRTYTDPLNYYTISYPSTWIVEKATGKNITGLNSTNPVTQQVEISQLYAAKQTGITIQIVEGTPSCPFTNVLTTKLAGYPANFDQTTQTWSVPTSNATIQVSLEYPGLIPIDGQLNNSDPTPNQAELPAIKQTLNTSIKSLHFSHVKPLSC